MSRLKVFWWSLLCPWLLQIFICNLFNVWPVQKAQLKLLCFKRDEDDTFLTWLHGRAKLDEGVDFLNKPFMKILFTMEVEQQSQLPFLHVLVYKKGHGSWGWKAYRKPTHTILYLSNSSQSWSCPKEHHAVCLSSYVGLTISDPQHLKKPSFTTEVKFIGP